MISTHNIIANKLQTSRRKILFLVTLAAFMLFIEQVTNFDRFQATCPLLLGVYLPLVLVTFIRLLVCKLTLVSMLYDSFL